MNIVLDGVIFEQQTRGGVLRIYQETLPRICDLDPAIQLMLLTYGPLRSRWPDHAQINHRRLWPLHRYIQPWKYLWSVKKCIRSQIAGHSLRNQAHEVWHSTNYTLPHRWNGPILISAYDLLIERYASLFDEPPYHQIRSEIRRCIAAADGVICISETTKKDIIDFYQADSSKLYVVPLAHSELFQPLPVPDLKDKLTRQRPFFLYVGGRGRYKNFEIILQAFQNWRHKADVDLVVVGAEWSAAEREMLTRNKLHSHVRLVGHLDDQRLCALYNRAQAFIFPSLYEGFGLPLLEAMACGCPVIASRVPSTLEVAGEVPIYFEPTNAESLRDAFDMALDKTQNKERIHTGFTHLNNYSWDKTAQQTLDLYKLFST